jgi:hypothetical protein
VLLTSPTRRSGPPPLALAAGAVVVALIGWILIAQITGRSGSGSSAIDAASQGARRFSPASSPTPSTLPSPTGLSPFDPHRLVLAKFPTSARGRDLELDVRGFPRKAIKCTYFGFRAAGTGARVAAYGTNCAGWANGGPPVAFVQVELINLTDSPQGFDRSRFILVDRNRSGLAPMEVGGRARNPGGLLPPGGLVPANGSVKGLLAFDGSRLDVLDRLDYDTGTQGLTVQFLGNQVRM